MKLSLKDFRRAAAMAAHIDVDEMTAAITGSARALDALDEEYARWKRMLDTGLIRRADHTRLGAAIDGVLAFRHKSSGGEGITG